MANTSTSLRGITKVSHAPPGAVKSQSVSAVVASGVGQAVSLASLKSVSPASARVEDITGRDDDLMQEAAAFMAAYSSAGGPALENFSSGQPPPLVLLGNAPATKQAGSVTPAPEFAKLQLSVVESEQRLVEAMEDIKVIQANGGKIGEREAALLKSPTGALLPSLAAAACAGKGGVGGLAGKGTGEEDEEGEAQAREMAAAAVLAVGPELEAAMADAAAAQSIGSARRQAPEDTEIPQETPHESARVGKGPQRGNDAESGSNSPRGSARRQVVVRTEWQALLNGRTALQHCWLVDCYRTRVDAEYRSGRPPASQRVGAEAQTVPQFSSPQISSP